MLRSPSHSCTFLARFYHLASGALREVSSYEVAPGTADSESLVLWLEGVLATARDIAPVPSEIARRLGAGTSSHALDRATLAALYEEHSANHSVRLKKPRLDRSLT